jgi:hypothetical protein
MSHPVRQGTAVGVRTPDLWLRHAHEFHVQEIGTRVDHGIAVPTEIGERELGGELGIPRGYRRGEIVAARLLESSGRSEGNARVLAAELG